MFTLRWSVVVFAFFLAACGTGQPADTGDQTSIDPSAEPVVIEGRAAQGVLASARVDVYTLNDDIRRHRKKTYTDEEGNFSVRLDQVTAPLVLEVTAARDGRSQMVCGALNGCDQASFGERGPLPEDFRLTTLVTPHDLDGRPVAITPLTHLATGWARSLPGSVDAQSLRRARERVADLMSLSSDFAFQRIPDITSDDGPVDDTAAARHALMAVAFADRATRSDRKIQHGLNGHLEALINHDGQLRVQGSYSLRGLLVSAGEIAAQRNILPGARAKMQALKASDGTGQTRLASADPALEVAE